MDRHTTGPFRSDVSVEDDHPRSVSKSLWDGGPCLDRHFEAVRSPIGEPMGEQGRRQAHRGVQRWAARECGPQPEELVAVADRPGVGGGSELPHTRRLVGSSQPSLRSRSATTLGSVPTPVRVTRAASSASVTTWGV